MATIEIDLPSCTGTITIPDYLDAQMFNEWWRKSTANDESGDYPALVEWRNRFHFIQSHSLKMQAGEIEESGMKLPDMRIAFLFIGGTDDLLDQSINPKKEPGKS